MADRTQQLIATRGAQMFPRLSNEELTRLSRFGEPRRYRTGEPVVKVGEPGPGLLLILSGEIEVVRHEGAERAAIVKH